MTGVRRIGLVIAMYREIPAPFTWPMPWQIACQTFGDREVHIVVSGIGTWNARRAARRVCEAVRPHCLMTLGFCGGVREGIEVGDLILADRVADMHQEIRLAKELIDRCITVMKGRARCHRGKLQTVKLHAFSRKDVGGDALAVDMEAFAVADVASAYGIPAVVVKSVSDEVPETPSAMGIWRFMQMRSRKYRIARAALEEFVKCFLGSDPGMAASAGEAEFSPLELREESSCP